MPCCTCQQWEWPHRCAILWAAAWFDVGHFGSSLRSTVENAKGQHISFPPTFKRHSHPPSSPPKHLIQALKLSSALGVLGMAFHFVDCFCVINVGLGTIVEVAYTLAIPLGSLCLLLEVGPAARYLPEPCALKGFFVVQGSGGKDSAVLVLYCSTRLWLLGPGPQRYSKLHCYNV